jgi:hypothetical protein
MKHFLLVRQIELEPCLQSFFEIGPSFLFRLAWLQSSYFVLPKVAKLTGVHHHTPISVEIGSNELFAHAGLEL